MRRRILSFVLCLCLVLSLIPAAAADANEQLWFRGFKWDSGNLVEDTESELYDPATMITSIGWASTVWLYGGTDAASAQKLETGTLTSSNANVVAVSENSSTGGAGCYFVEAVGLGSASLTWTDGVKSITRTIEVSELPSYAAFYSSNDRSAESYITHFEYDSVNGNKLWYLGENSIGDQWLVDLSVRCSYDSSTEVIEGSTAEVYHVSDDVKGIEITIPGGIDFGVSGNVDVEIYSSGNLLQGIMMVIPEPPVEPFPERTSYGNTVTIGEYTLAFLQQDNQHLTARSGDTPKTWYMSYYGDIYSRISGYQQLAVGYVRTNAEGMEYFEYANPNEVRLNVTKMTIESTFGEPGVFSWSESELVSEKTGDWLLYPGQPAVRVPLYAKYGVRSEALITAEVEVTIAGSTTTHTISMTERMDTIENKYYSRPADDTMEKLNAFLEELAQSVDVDTAKRTAWQIELAATTYEGTLTLPEEFTGNNGLVLVGNQFRNYGDHITANKTVIDGGIDINGAYLSEVTAIHFRANENVLTEGKTKGLYGGNCASMGYCTLYGYDVAVDCTEGYLTTMTYTNVFVNNDVGINVDIKNVDKIATNIIQGNPLHWWSNCVFINNGTAIKVLSLNDEVTSYSLRPAGCNFINNGTDFYTEVDGDAMFFIDNSYFGEYVAVNGHRPNPGKFRENNRSDHAWLRLNELSKVNTRARSRNILVSRPAEIDNPNGAQVIASPRYDQPIKNWWSFDFDVSELFFGEGKKDIPPQFDDEQEYQYKKKADWGVRTAIDNDNAASNLIDASSFDEETESKKEVEVVDGKSGKALGKWKFD